MKTNVIVDVFTEKTSISIKDEKTYGVEVFAVGENVQVNVSDTPNEITVTTDEVVAISLYDEDLFNRTGGVNMGDADTLDGYHALAFPRKIEKATITGEWDFTNKLGIKVPTGEAKKADFQNEGTSIMQGKILFGDDIESREGFVSGFSGYGFRYDNETGHLTIDNLTVRKMMRVYELLISQIRASNGSIWVSDAAKIKEVVNMPEYWRCTIDTDGGSVAIPYRENDLIRCQRWTGKGIKYYSAKIIAIGGDFFDVEKNGIEGLDIPEAGDDTVRIGNTTDTNRQGAIYITSSDDYAPYIDVMDGVDSFSFKDKVKVRLGRLNGISFHGQELEGYGAFMQNAYLTGAAQSAEGTWKLNADGSGSLANGGITWTKEGVITFKSVTDYVEQETTAFGNQVAESLSLLQSQIDGKAEYWFQEASPSTNWTSDVTRESHVGDRWYKASTREAWTWNYGLVNDVSELTWVEVDKTDPIYATMVNAANAQDTADGKRTVFVREPTAPYKEGDLWLKEKTVVVNGVSTSTAGDIMRCKVPRGSTEKFYIDDWVKASDYTGDEELNNFINTTFKTFSEDLTAVKAQVDKKVVYYFQNTDPNTTTPLTKENIGDQWYNTSTRLGYVWDNIVVDGVSQLGWEKITDSFAILALQNAAEASDTADKKRQVFVNSSSSQPTGPFDIGDLWVQGGDGDIYKCKTKRETNEVPYTTIDYWDYACKYTDDSVANAKTKTYYGGTWDKRPDKAWTEAEKTNNIGDLWLRDDTRKNPTTGSDESTQVEMLWTGLAWVENVSSIDGGRINAASIKAGSIAVDSLLAGQILLKSVDKEIGGFTIKPTALTLGSQTTHHPTEGQEGIWMGKVAEDYGDGFSRYKFFVGNLNNYVLFNGSNLIISGNAAVGIGKDSIPLSDIAAIGKWFTVMNPGQTNEYLKLNGSLAATGEVAAYQLSAADFDTSFWEGMPLAGANTVGGIKIGSGLTIVDGVVSVDASAIGGNQTLSFAGSTLSISNGNSVDLSSLAPTWANISGKPTTLVGYGITDAIPKLTIDGIHQDDVTMSGFYRSNGAYLAQYINLRHPESTAYGFQIGNAYDDALRFRNKIANVWGAYHAIWHDGNFTPANYSLTSHAHTTSVITEGTNLYHTDARARGACASSGTVYDSARLGGVTASSYTRRDVAETIGQSWTFNSILKAAGSFRTYADNTYIGCEDGQADIRLGMVKKTGAGAFFASGSVSNFSWKISSTTGINDVLNNTYTEVMSLSNGGNLSVVGKIKALGLTPSTVLVSDTAKGIVSSSVTADKLVALADMFDFAMSGNTKYIKANFSLASVGELAAYSAGASFDNVWNQMPLATTTSKGGIIIGSGLTIVNGVVSVNASYGTHTLSLVGSTLYINGGGGVNLSTLTPTWDNIQGKPETFAPSAHNHSFDSLTGKKTTLAGYGITDAIPKLTIDGVHQDDVQWSGFYRSNAGTLRQYINLRHPESTAYGFQIGNAYDDALRFRNRIAGVWGAYHAIWHDGNFTPANYSLTSHAHTTSVITEGTNLYYTQSRFDSAFSNKSTSNLQEGTNKYFTDARARNACAVSGQVYDSARLGGVVASSYPRRDVTETIGQSWTFNSGLVASRVEVNGNYIEIKGVTTSACLSLDGVPGTWSYLRFMINGVLRWDVGINDVNNKFEFRPNQVTVATIDVNGQITSKSIVAENTITSKNMGITSTTGIGDGVSLYNGQSQTTTQSTYTFPTYGMFFGKTANFGTFGSVTSDWAVYFTVNDVVNRGWIFKKGTTNVLSISTAGNAYANGEISAVKYYARNSGGLCFQAGDDAAIWDVNIAHTLGVYSATNNAVGGIQLGSGGIKLYGTSGSLYAYGNIVSTGEVTAYSSSDANLKTAVQDIQGRGLSTLKLLRPVEFEWNDIAKKLNPEFARHTHSASFIAQEYETVFGWATHTIWGKYKSIDKSILFPYLVAGVNELDYKIDNVEDRLNRRIEELENEVKQLKSMI